MFSKGALRNRVRNSILYVQMAVLAVAGIAPVLNVGTVGAEQLTSRKATIGTSKPETSTTYDLQFSWASSLNPQSMVVQFCNDPLGTCTLPGSVFTGSGYAATGKEMNVTTNGAVASSTGFPNAFDGEQTSAQNGCSDVGTAASTMLCFTASGSNPAATATDAVVNLTGIRNPGLPDAANNKTVYVRIMMYSGSTFSGSPILEGTVAVSINQQLTVNGRVQERLNFCVAAAEDTGTSDAELPTTMAACSAINDTVIDLGVIDNGGVAKSPVPNSPPSSLGNASYGIAMLNTNASNGTAITYFAEPDATSGAANQLRAFRVPGASCSTTASTLTDQCFISALAAGEALTAGTERFGMNVPCIIQLDGANPTINGVLTTTTNLEATTAYNGDGTITPAADCEKTEPATTGGKYAWNETSAAVPIAQSSALGSKVVDNEIVKLNFAATAGATTPTGSYTVVSTYIATPTY